MLLGIILTSLEDHSHVSSLLGYSCSMESEDRLGSQDLHLAEVLMKTLLQNLSFHTVSTCPVYSCICYITDIILVLMC
jgi:E3 ubiquitin-protein ligase HERC1